jgi:hypothetical protein
VRQAAQGRDADVRAHLRRAHPRLLDHRAHSRRHALAT